MTRSEFSTILIHARRWTNFVYFVSGVTLMLLIAGVGYIWSSELQKLTLVFRDERRPIGEDGTYGAILGLLMGVFFVVPSMGLPLWFAAIADRRLGIACSACGSSLTFWKYGNIVLRTGNCPRCAATVLESARAENEEEQDGPQE